MKKFFKILLAILFLVFIYVFRDNIYNLYNVVILKRYVSPLELNEYSLKNSYDYVQITDNFVPNNKKDILNIYFTVVNSGMESFQFYCPKEYKKCSKDLYDIANDQNTLSNLNNFVHPYNTFKTISTNLEENGKVTLEVNKVYDDKMIILLEDKIDEIYNNNYDENKSIEDNIKVFHDYIINNCKYDKDRSDKKIENYKSDNAFGVLKEGYGICGGYTDAMQLFLHRLGLQSIKISTENHIWNYVKVNDNWLHMDLTWDDPVMDNGSNILDHSYFLITEKQLMSLEKEEHIFNKSIYNF